MGVRRVELFLRAEDRSALEESCRNGECGACCENVGYPPFVIFDTGEEVKDKDWARLSEQQRRAIFDHIDAHKHLPDGTYGTPCLWYNAATRRCKNYDLRPEICKDFEAGGSDCVQIRAVVTIQRKLNGEGNGDQ